MNSLAKYSIHAAIAQLEKASTFEEVMRLRDQGAAWRAAAEHVEAGKELAMKAGEFTLMAELKLGEMSAALEKHQGKKTLLRGETKSKTLDDVGLSRKRAAELERLADVDLDSYFDACRESERVPTLRGALSISSASDYDGDEWFTPSEWVERARAALGGTIDLDPASNAHAQKTVRAAKFYTKADDGLSKPWTGRVFCNPPYSTALIKAFSDKLIASREELRDCTAAVYLVNNCTDAGWFQDCLHWCDAVCFPRGRIAFENARGVGFATRQGQAFFWFGEDAGPFRAAFKDCGWVS